MVFNTQIEFEIHFRIGTHFEIQLLGPLSKTMLIKEFHIFFVMIANLLKSLRDYPNTKKESALSFGRISIVNYINASLKALDPLPLSIPLPFPYWLQVGHHIHHRDALMQRHQVHEAVLLMDHVKR